MEVSPKCSVGNKYLAYEILHDYENELIIECINTDYRRLQKEWFQIGAIFRAGETNGYIIWEYMQKWSDSGWSFCWLKERNVNWEGHTARFQKDG